MVLCECLHWANTDQASPNHVPKMEMKNIFIFNFSKNHQFTGPNQERIFFQFSILFCRMKLGPKFLSAKHAERNWDPSFFLQNIRKKLE
jgi:hypothetical protein